MNLKESQALIKLNSLIFEGVEFPDAIFKVTQKTEVSAERLQELYDQSEDGFFL